MNNENDVSTTESSAASQNQSVSNAPASPQTSEPQWYIDEKTPGMGTRPDWLPSKYKSAQDVARAYENLEKKLGAFTGAPEQYDLSALEIDENQHIVKELTSVAKELNMSQEGLQKFLGRFATAAEAEGEAHLEQEVARLGPDGQRQLMQFKNIIKDRLKPEEQEYVTSWVRSAEDLQLFNRIMAGNTMSSVPTQHTMANATFFESVSDLRAELAKNVDRYNSDSTYRKDFSTRMERAVGREGR